MPAAPLQWSSSAGLVRLPQTFFFSVTFPVRAAPCGRSRLRGIACATGLARGCEDQSLGKAMSRIAIFRGQARRRWSDDEKRRMVAETLVPGATVHSVAQRHGVNTSLFTWRKRFRTEFDPRPAEPPVPAFAAVELTMSGLTKTADGPVAERMSLRPLA